MAQKIYNPGMMRDRIQVMQRTITTINGVPKETWETLYATLWAEAEELRGAKLVESGAYTDIGQVKFWVRDSTVTRGITPTDHRIIWNSRTWNIQSNPLLSIVRGMREIFCIEIIKESTTA